METLDSSETNGFQNFLDDISRLVSSGEDFELSSLVKKYNLPLEEAKKTLIDVLHAPLKSHEMLSDKFNELRAQLQFYGLKNEKLTSLKKKIKKQFEAIGHSKKSSVTILQEIDVLVEQLEYEIKKEIPLAFNDGSETVEYLFKDDFGNKQKGVRTRKEIAHICADYTSKGKPTQ